MSDNGALFENQLILDALGGVGQALKRIEAGAKQYNAIVGTTVYKNVLEHFELQEGPDGGWKAWSDIYEQHMQKRGKAGNLLLQDTGRMRNSFRPSNFRHVPGGVLFYNPAKTSEGFPYAYAHDKGGDKLPQRQFMWLSDFAMEEVADKTVAFVLDKFFGVT